MLGRILLFFFLPCLSACQPAPETAATSNITASAPSETTKYEGEMAFRNGSMVSYEAEYQELPGKKVSESIYLTVTSAGPDDPTYLKGHFLNGVLLESQVCTLVPDAEPYCSAISAVTDHELQKEYVDALYVVFHQLRSRLFEQFQNRNRSPQPPPASVTGRATAAALFSVKIDV